MHGHTHKQKHKKNTLINLKELQYKQKGEEYAIVNSDKGSSRFEVTIYTTNQIVLAKARGSICKGPRKQRIDKGDFILIVQDDNTSSGDKYYIIHKYSPDDVKRLKKAGELIQYRESNNDDKKADAFIFDNEMKVDPELKLDIDNDFISNI
jgi:initiation factor 1A